MKHIHILGISGTFMAGIATIAKQTGCLVTGQDQNCYPPMSDYLDALRIEYGGYEQPMPEGAQIIVGNVMRRGMPMVETMLNQKKPLISGPAWLYENVLQHKNVLCVAGTHGKTTTASMLAWILEANGLNPGFLIGGLPGNFDVSARYTDSDYFVIEGDEYDTAFFDKRSKFIHYRPDVFVINNLEFDHADIFDDLKMIQTQFHHALKTLPSEGYLINTNQSEAIEEVIEKGLFSRHETCGKEGDWQAKLNDVDGSSFEVRYRGKTCGTIEWNLIGDHNVQNALSAIAAAHKAGVKPDEAVGALSQFKGVRRRLELRGKVNSVSVYDDFAHHPSAVASTIKGLKDAHPNARVIAVLEPRSNTMKQGVHQATLVKALADADGAYLFQSGNVNWDMKGLFGKACVYESIERLLETLSCDLKADDHVVIMSNGAFENIHERLIAMLNEKQMV